MGYVLGLLSRPIGLMILGGLIMAFTGMLLHTAWTPLPELSALDKIEGYLERVSNAPHKSGESQTSPPYQVEITSTIGQKDQIVIPRFIIPDDTIRQLRRGERFIALRAANGDIWGLQIGDRNLMDYESRRARVSTTHAQTRFWAPVGLVGGGLLSLLGVIWRRKERSGYFSDFIHSLLFLSLALGFSVYLVMMANDYRLHRRVTAEGVDTNATVVRGEIVSRSLSNHWLLLSWPDAASGVSHSMSVPVTKAFYETLASRQAAGPMTIPVRYSIIQGNPAVVIPEISADIEWAYRGYLLFFGACSIALIWMLTRPTWRLWRRWRDTPRAGL